MKKIVPLSVTVRPNAERMAATIKLLRQRVRAFGSRPLTEQDFYSICQRRAAFVIDERKQRKFMEQVGGIYLNIAGIPTIILNGHSTGFNRLWTMFHELGHPSSTPTAFHPCALVIKGITK